MGRKPEDGQRQIFGSNHFEIIDLSSVNGKVMIENKNEFENRLSNCKYKNFW